MDAPPIHYARTVDGYDIAYAVNGSSPPIVWLPSLYSHLSWNWTMPHGDAYERAAKRNTVVHYDGRGQGLSSRDLREPATIEGLASDIEAVVTRLGLARYALFVTHAFGPVALWYAARHPDEVAGLIAWNYLDYRDGREYGPLGDLAARDWQFYLHTMRSVALPGVEASRAAAFLEAATNQADFLNIRHALQSADLRALAAAVSAPALVVVEHEGGGGPTRDATAQTLAATLADATLTPLDAASASTAVEATIVSFLDCLSWEQPHRATATLSDREIEVLRLIAAGRSNAQIADALIISPNTVGRHVSNIFDKTGAANRAEATAYALRHGLA